MQRGVFDFGFDVPHERIVSMWLNNGGLLFDVQSMNPGTFPEGIANGTSPDVYDAYRRGRDSACADIVIAARRPDGTKVVLLSLRKKNVCFGGKWWHYGGAILSYADVSDFVAERAKKECGVDVLPKVLLGFYRTCAEDNMGSTFNICFAAQVPYYFAEKKVIDSGHDAARLFTLDELRNIPAAEQHWYPMRVCKLVFDTMR